MKFVIAALLGLVSASNMQAEIKIDQALLKDEMEALLELTQQVETREQSEIFDAVEVRKEVLKVLAGEMPERKQAIANEVTNLRNVVGRVLEEDYDGAVNELEARKDELMDIHNYLTSLVDVGAKEYNMWTQNTSGQGTQTKGFAKFTFNDDNTVTGSVDYTEGAATDTFADDAAVAITGQYSNDEDDMENPDDTKWTQWTIGDNVYWTENEGGSPFYYSGKIDDEGKIVGNYKKAGDPANGKFEFTIFTAPVDNTPVDNGQPQDECDAACKAKKIAQDAADKARELAQKTKDALQGKNGVAIGLGVGGGLLAVASILYCCLCKKACFKPKDMMTDDNEGGKKANKQSLLVQTEEA